MLRTPGKFEPYQETATDNYERLYLTHQDISNDDTKKSEFVIRHPHKSHMSTVVMLERSYRLEKINPLSGQPETVDRGGLPDYAEINQPGFALQNIMESFQINYGGTTLIDNPSKWLPWYSRLYSKTLESCVRKSGRNFANHHGLPNYFEYDNRFERLIDIKEVELEHFNQAGSIIFPDEVRSNEGWDYKSGALGLSNADAFELIVNWRPDRDGMAARNAVLQSFQTMTTHLPEATPHLRKTKLVQIIAEYETIIDIPLAQRSQAQKDRATEIQPIVDALTVFEEAVSTTTPFICNAALNFWQQMLSSDNTVKISGGGSFQPQERTDYTADEVLALRKKNHFLLQVDNPKINTPEYATGRNIFESYWNMSEGAPPNEIFRYQQDRDRFDQITANGATDQQKRDALAEGMMTGHLPKTCKTILEQCGLDKSPIDADPAKQQARTDIFGGMHATAFAAMYPFYKLCDAMYSVHNQLLPKVHPQSEITIYDYAADWREAWQNHFVVKFREPLVLGPHKPMLGPMVGCWQNTGDVLPRVDEITTYSINWLAEDRLFKSTDLNWAVVPQSTKLHTMHFRGDFDHLYQQHELKIPIHDFEVFDLGNSLRNVFEVRTTFGPPQLILFYTQFMGQIHKSIETLNMAHNIKKLKIRVDSASEVVFDDNIDHVTASRFAEYVPQHNWYRGNMLCIPFNSLPRGNSVNVTKQLEVQWELEQSLVLNDPINNLTSHLFCALIYKDKFVSMKKHVQQSGWM